MNIENYSVLDDTVISQEFFVHIWPKRDLFQHLKIHRNINDAVQRAILKKFNLSSIQQLRDKFEGVAYYDKTFRRIGGYHCVDYFVNDKVSESLLEIDLNMDFTKIIIGNAEVEIVTFRFGQLPRISTSDKRDKFMVIQRDNSHFYLCGLLPYSKLKLQLKKNPIQNSSYVFKDFDLLTQKNIKSDVGNK